MPRTSSATNLTIRRIDPEVKERLRARATRRGHTMEAELYDILLTALEQDRPETPNLAHAIRRRMAALGGIDLPEHPPVPLPLPPDFVA